MFLKINHISDVLPHLEGRKEFVVAQREWGTAIDYMYMDVGTFDEPMRRECRGLKFDLEGNLIARPYAKFFNVGEKPETQEGALPWHEPHVVLEKLDGSMIHMAGGLWMTRMGHTDVAKASMEGMPNAVDRLARVYDAAGMTCIFEWCSPRNRIVIKYDSDRWVLTGMRTKQNGRYAPYDVMKSVAEEYGVEVVKAWGASVKDVAAFMDHTRGLKDEEGYVVRWDNGLMVKVKADEYVLRHKSKDGLAHEKNVLRLIIDNLVDDTIPLLPPEDARTLRAYERATHHAINYWAMVVHNGVNLAVGPDPKHPITDRKTFALRDVPTLHPLLKAVAFKTWEGHDPVAAIHDVIRKHTGTQTDVEKMRGLFSQSWESFYRAPKMDN